jgi:hypothetical protein
MMASYDGLQSASLAKFEHFDQAKGLATAPRFEKK